MTFLTEPPLAASWEVYDGLWEVRHPTLPVMVLYEVENDGLAYYWIRTVPHGEVPPWL